MLTANDKKLLLAIRRKFINLGKVDKQVIENALVKYHNKISKELNKFLRIRCLLTHHYIVYLRYTQSLTGKQTYEEVIQVLSKDNICKHCGKTIRVDNARKGQPKYGIAFFRKRKKYCRRQCQNTQISRDNWKQLKLDKEKAQQRINKIQATMLKRYGAKTTLQSKVLLQKVLDTKKRKQK